MASSSDPLNEELQCSICLDAFTDPVTTPCGHNFCTTCLNKCWTDIQTFSCPLCKAPFHKRPHLHINTTLSKVVQHFKEKLNVGESEVLCDFCDVRKKKAVKSCLTCQSSYCETHLEPHRRVPRLKKHSLINAVEDLEDYTRQKHQRPLELFCRDDQTCACLFCTEGDHRTHNTVPIGQERHKKTLASTHFSVLWMVSGLGVLLVAVLFMMSMEYTSTGPRSVSDDIKVTQKREEKSASAALFTDLTHFIESRQSELLKMMEKQQKAAEKQAEDLINELQREITELKRRNTDLEQLSHPGDPYHTIQMYSSLYSLSHISSWFGISDVNTRSLKTALTLLKKQLNEELSRTELKCVQKFAVNVTLDPDTANPHLILSDDGKQVHRRDIKQDVPENPKRFDEDFCVQAKEGFGSGRFYYEVQVKGKSHWDLGVVRESITRKGEIRLNPAYGLWTVALRSGNRYIACGNPFVPLSLKVNPERVGVFVDYEEGLVSFYDGASGSQLYSFTGQTFTDKLYPFLSLGDNDPKPLVITPVS